jgi:cellulose synthase/poly-beta-1,6-N-acetylglucosamine synthase-like glycosyltransferase
MISIVITTFKEPQTLPLAIDRILKQKNIEPYELLVIGPDQETKEIVQKISQNNSQVKYFQDQGKGKPAALNLAFEKAKGDIIVSTDGDVLVGSGAIENLVSFFKNPKVGAVSGQPISTNLRHTIWGYWSHFLTNAADQMRRKKTIWPCSGYLYAFRKIKEKIPVNAFSEDAFITALIRQKGYLIKYAPRARVYVKYPCNLRDWLRQKVRSTGGYLQKISNSNNKISLDKLKVKKMRNSSQEIQDGIKLFFSYPQNIKEYFWTFLLYLARIYLWLSIFWKIVVLRTKFHLIWKRVESTK